MSLLDTLFQLDLFGQPAAPAPRTEPTLKERRRRSRHPSGWMLVDHACRSCMGRVLVRMERGQVAESRCAECGNKAEGHYTEVCCCGAEAGTMGRILECFRNPAVSPAVPQEVLVRERAIEAKPLPPRVPKPVGDKGY